MQVKTSRAGRNLPNYKKTNKFFPIDEWKTTFFKPTTGVPEMVVSGKLFDHLGILYYEELLPVRLLHGMVHNQLVYNNHSREAATSPSPTIFFGTPWLFCPTA